MNPRNTQYYCAKYHGTCYLWIIRLVTPMHTGDIDIYTCVYDDRGFVSGAALAFSRQELACLVPMEEL